MNRKETITLIVLISILIAINIVKYINQQKNYKTYELIIEESMKQISINNADTNDFKALPGIGPVLARRIIEYREKNGGFKTISDLRKVKGIGENLFKRIEPFIKL
ncbi:MAG: ComEA family DNA-binding protein [bacterium]